jgi:predicted MFS family arabinose efflux permease
MSTVPSSSSPPRDAENSDADDPDGEDPDPAALPGGHPPAAAGPPRSDAEGDRLFTRPFVGVLAMQAAYGFSFSLFFLLPKYLATLGDTPSRIGFVMAGFGVACLVTIPFLAAIVGRLGQRGTLVAATLLLAVAAATFGLVDRPGWLAIPLRASEGITWTLMFSTAGALTAEMAPRHRLAQAIGLAGAASLIMNAVAPAIGEPLADRFGYRAAFLLSALAALTASALARRLPAAAAGGDPRRSPPPARPPAAPRGSSARLPIYAVFGAAGLAFHALFTFLAPYALSHGVHAIRAFFVAYTGAALTVRLLGGRMSDRLGHRSVATFALLLYGLVVASAGLLAPHHLALLGMAFGFAHGAVYPALLALLIGDLAPQQRPRVLGVANGAMSIGVSAVFPAGVLVTHLGYPAMFALAGGLTAASAALLRRSGSGTARSLRA